MYKGVGESRVIVVPSVETEMEVRIFECEGERRWMGMGDDAEEVRMMRTCAWSFEKSFEPPIFKRSCHEVEVTEAITPFTGQRTRVVNLVSPAVQS